MGTGSASLKLEVPFFHSRTQSSLTYARSTGGRDMLIELAKPYRHTVSRVQRQPYSTLAYPFFTTTTKKRWEGRSVFNWKKRQWRNLGISTKEDRGAIMGSA